MNLPLRIGVKLAESIGQIRGTFKRAVILEDALKGPLIAKIDGTTLIEYTEPKSISLAFSIFKSEWIQGIIYFRK